jgi:2-aminoadipate transaminase
LAGQFRVRRENVLITTGGQQALDLIGRVLLDRGDRVVVENPTYLALLAAWRPTGVEFVPVPCDGEGMRTEELEVLLQGRPKAIYSVPNFQNPQGTTLSLSRRKRLVALAREYSTVVVEDNPYGELRYSGEALPHLVELDDQVIHVGTFSKVLMPGLRVGWVIAPEVVIDKLTPAKQAADLHTSTLAQHLALELASKGFLDTFVPVLCENYRKRRDAMLGALERYFPKSATWTRPEGGMFLLVTLASGVNTGELLAAALKHGVAYVPGEEFHINGEGKNTMRLSFSSAPPERIEEGIKRLGEVLKAES